MSPSALPRFASTLVALGAIRLGAAWPLKVVDFSEEGDLCDTTTTQYMQVETYDFHDYPKFTMTWRQLTGVCGADEPNPVEWTGSYDSAAGDEPPDEEGRVQLALYVCAPFGEYELELVVESTSDAGSTLEQRTAWQVEYGVNEFHIWDTVNGPFFGDDDYSPTVPGTYVWPLSGSTGYYSTLYAGPLPQIQCPDSIPTGAVYQGCYEDSPSSRTLGQDQLNLPGRENPSGMTLQVCADFCSEYQYFGVQYAYECFCGTASEFSSATESDGCGSTYQYLCTGDSTVTCGDVNAISIYEQTNATPPPAALTPAPTTFQTLGSPTPAPTTFQTLGSPTPAPVDDPTSPPAPSAPTSSSYIYEGCFVDSKSSRIMTSKTTQSTMSADICLGICDDGENNYFGTQFSTECWCGVDSDLTVNGEEAVDSECDMDCAGTTTDEKCGGFNRLSAYQISTDPTPAPAAPTPAPTTFQPFIAPTPAPVDDPTSPPAPSAPTSSSYTYEGCFVDSKSSRIMTSSTTQSTMSADICLGICDDGVNNYFGTQYSTECWCGVDSDLTVNGEEAADSECDMDCAGTTTDEKCGGFFRLSAYQISTDSTPAYVGCYGDANSPRAMPGAGKYSLAGMTNELCWDRCSGLGYAYAGNQYGVECWCDNAFDTYGEVDACTYECGGDSSQTCGGFNALSVYEL